MKKIETKHYIIWEVCLGDLEISILCVDSTHLHISF